jgi:hypothetical protein
MGDFPPPTEWGKLDYKPGDVIVFRYEHKMTKFQMTRIKDDAEQALPGARVIVLTDGLTIETVLSAGLAATEVEK